MYFPYPSYRQGQKEIADTIQEHSIVVIEAATGSGKTIASLASLLEKRQEDERIVVVVRTINQMNPVLREWAQLQKHTDEEITILPLLGRSRLDDIKHKLGKRTIITRNSALGKRMRKKAFAKLQAMNHRERLLKWINRRMLENPSISQFRELLSTRENSAYDSCWSILRDADIVILSYGHLKQLDRVLEHIGPLERIHLLVDEAHNFMFDRFHGIRLPWVVVMIKMFGKHPHLQELVPHFKGLREASWDELIDNFPIKRKQLLEFFDASQDILHSDDPKLELIPKYLMHNNVLEGVVIYLREFFINYNAGSLLISGEHMNIASFRPWEQFTRLQQAKSLVLQSGTISPARQFIKLFGLPENTKHLDLIEKDVRKLRKDPKRFKACYASSLSSSSRYRNHHIYDRYGTAVWEIFQRSPGHVLVLCPSYMFVEGMAIRFKNAVVKELNTSSTDELYQQIMKPTKYRKLIIGHQTGKIMEGNEWVVNGRSIVSTVVLVGLAMRVPREVDEYIQKVKAKQLQDENMASLFMHQIPLSIVAEQAYGRTRRHPEDRGALIILDDRVDPYMQKRLWLSRYTKLDNLLTDLEQFFQLTPNA